MLLATAGQNQAAVCHQRYELLTWVSHAQRGHQIWDDNCVTMEKALTAS